MSISQALLPEFDNEMAVTRKFFATFPEDLKDWTPHEKSMPLGKLTSHIAELATWAANTVESDSLNLAPKDCEPYQTVSLDTREALLEAFDRDVAAAREAIGGASDEHLMLPWSLESGDNTIFTMPRIAVIRSFVMNHMIHHRAQLGVYYRLNGVAVPASYGPSADDQSF